MQKYRLKNYGGEGGDLVLEIEASDASPAEIREIKEGLPVDVLARVIGHRTVAMLAIP